MHIYRAGTGLSLKAYSSTGRHTHTCEKQTVLPGCTEAEMYTDSESGWRDPTETSLVMDVTVRAPDGVNAVHSHSPVLSSPPQVVFIACTTAIKGTFVLSALRAERLSYPIAGESVSLWDNLA
ncbi:hypothetical protein BaRGS_00024096 [Batillaria attramentaria]|uniref:Uncharacterized protein n=1 Tax=Batillaria attramentaria TaxID=370345 RepID=A0ABD0KC43_9CAEN